MNSRIFGWDLPAGCTNADVDRAAGVDMECPKCAGDGCDDCEQTGIMDRRAKHAEALAEAAEARADAIREDGWLLTTKF